MIRDFPFTIREIAGLLNLTVRYGKEGSGNMDVDCPFCYKRSKMNLNAVKNVYRCNYCGEYGGMVQLYGKIHKVPNAEAYWEICELLNRDGKNPVNYGNPVPSQAVAAKPINRADNDTLHQTYSMLLSLLTLANPHKEQLLARGLPQNHIARFGYKSVPAFGQQGLCAKLIQSGCILEGVPGFYKEDGVWTAKLKAPGILVPVCGIDGKIAGMQIRLNKPINNRKYIWLSSTDKECGTSSGAPVHFVGDPAAKRVFVTEGALKGTVAHSLTGYTFICIPGVKSIGGLDSVLECLKANGTEEIIEALDMDKIIEVQTDEAKDESNTEKPDGQKNGNIHVATAAQLLREKIAAYEFKVKSAIWEDKTLNGIDDYFLHRMKAKRNPAYNTGIAVAA